MKHLYLVIIVLLAATMLGGCASVAHTVNLATLDDITDLRANQHKVDSKIVRAVADAIEKGITTEEMIARAKAAIDGSDVEWSNRPPAPDRWTEIILGVLGLLTTGVTTYHVTNRSRDRQREALGEATLSRPVPVLQPPQANPEAKT